MRILATLLLTSALVSPAVAGEDWAADFDRAAELARDQGKNLLVDFTGSDWCGWCIKLHDEVFQYDAFLDGTRDDWVLVSLDFPKSAAAKARVPDPGRNAELRDEYGISGFPTVLLMTPDGVVFGRTGYKAGGPDAYLAHLEELTREPLLQRRRAKEAVAAYDASDRGTEALVKLLDAFEAGLGSSPFGSLLQPAIRERLDVEDPGTRKRVVSALVQLGAVDADVLASAIDLDPRNEAGLYADALLTIVEDVAEEERIRAVAADIDAFFAVPDLKKVRRESSVMLLVFGSYWNANFLDDAEKAAAYARLGLERTKATHRARSLFRKLAGD